MLRQNRPAAVCERLLWVTFHPARMRRRNSGESIVSRSRNVLGAELDMNRHDIDIVLLHPFFRQITRAIGYNSNHSVSSPSGSKVSSPSSSRKRQQGTVIQRLDRSFAPPHDLADLGVRHPLGEFQDKQLLPLARKRRIAASNCSRASFTSATDSGLSRLNPTSATSSNPKIWRRPWSRCGQLATRVVRNGDTAQPRAKWQPSLVVPADV